MKEYLLANSEFVISFITVFITFICGKISKKSKIIADKIIPIQNILIAIIATFVYYYATGSFSNLIASSSPVATLIYDTIHNLLKEE